MYIYRYIHPSLGRTYIDLSLYILEFCSGLALGRHEWHRPKVIAASASRYDRKHKYT